MDGRIEFGRFSIPVPPSWQVSEQDGILQLVPLSSDGAVHFSLLKRSVPGLPTAADAQALIDNFALNQHLKVVGRIDFENCPGGVRAIASLESVPPDPAQPTHWQLLLLILEKVGLKGTLCADDTSSASFATARRILQQVDTTNDFSMRP